MFISKILFLVAIPRCQSQSIVRRQTGGVWSCSDLIGQCVKRRVPFDNSTLECIVPFGDLEEEVNPTGCPLLFKQLRSRRNGEKCVHFMKGTGDKVTTNDKAPKAGTCGVYRCPQYQYKHGGSCTSIHSTLVNWNEAESRCQREGGHLAEINTRDEQEFLKTLARTTTYDRIWIGGSDTHHEGQWIWVSGQSLRGLKWCQGQPDNGGFITQNCLTMSAKIELNCDLDLNDDTCFFRYIFICESDAKCEDPW